MTKSDRQDVLVGFGAMVKAQRAALAALARREGLGAEDAFDCVHDACCTFLQKVLQGEVTGETDHATLLRGIVVNTARNRRRRHYVARPHATLDVVEPVAEDPSTDVLMAYAEDCVRLRSCVNRLCTTERTVVMMRLLEERPGEDVAAALGLARGHVDVLLYRAKASLRVCMRQA